MSVKILLYTLLKQIGIFLVVSFLVFRGTFVESDSLGLNLSTGVSLLLSVILWGIINLHTYWLIPGYLFQRRYKKYKGDNTMYNKIILVGNLTTDIELKYSQGGMAIAKSAIATSRKFKSNTGEQ